MMGSKLSMHTFFLCICSLMRSAMGKPFDTFRVTLKQNGLEDFFRNSCFGHFLDLLQNNNARFQMTMVYELLQRRFIFQNPEKKDEVLINYCGMPLFFGRREFAIVSGLKCHPSSEQVPKFIRHMTHLCQHLTQIFLRMTHFYNFTLHPWLVPTEKELKMPYLITLGLVETLFDPVVDRVKMELAGARTIKRDRVVNELVIFDGVDGRGIDAGAGVGQDQGATSCRRCSGFLYEKCKKQDEDSIMYLQTLSQAVNEFKNKRGGQGHSIKECSASIYFTGQEEEKILYQGNTKFEEEDLWRIANGRTRGSIGVQACECL
ncbi:hypothetical protein R3W88_001076 [Solanum pinnatisectum]|uniref:DUF1985 domain-containing protein n=1 Tax=Solanum pinnatisectum TaxID=50273 RepID=A0AAV9MHI3_9SOLN|nr:hypothetical protein R3W88_001076 [Solanum pinnatisectum]